MQAHVTEMASLSGVAGQPALQHRAGQVAVARQDLDRSPRKTGSEHCFSGSENLRIWPEIGSQILLIRVDPALRRLSVIQQQWMVEEEYKYRNGHGGSWF